MLKHWDKMFRMIRTSFFKGFEISFLITGWMIDLKATSVKSTLNKILILIYLVLNLWFLIEKKN